MINPEHAHFEGKQDEIKRKIAKALARLMKIKTGQITEKTKVSRTDSITNEDSPSKQIEGSQKKSQEHETNPTHESII